MIKEHSQGAFSSLLFKNFAICGLDHSSYNFVGEPITNVQLCLGPKPFLEEGGKAIDLLGTQMFWLVYYVGGIESPVTNIDVLPALRVHRYLKVSTKTHWEPIPVVNTSETGFLLRKTKSDGELNFLECSKYDLNNFFDCRTGKDEGLVLVVERSPKEAVALADLKLVRARGREGPTEFRHQLVLPKGFSGFLHLEIESGQERRTIAYSRLKTSEDSVCAARVLDIYPDLTASARQKIIDVLPEFCFPKGIKFFDRDQNPCYFNFMFTNEEGKRTYISSLRFTEKLLKNPFLKKAKKQEESPLFVQKAYCLMAEYPFYEKMTTILLEFYRLHGQYYHTPIEGVLSNLIKHVPCPMPGGSSVLYELNSKVVRFHRPLSYPKTQTQSFECLLTFLDPAKVLKVVEYILLEKKILLVTENGAVLALVIDALLSLVFPFKWNQRLIPILPDSLKHYAESPLPFIIGIVKDSHFDEAQLHLSSDVIRVYLDSNDVFALDIEGFGISSHVLKGTVQRLEPFWQYHKAASALPFKKTYGLALDFRKSSALLRLETFELRDVFMELMGKIASGYHQFIRGSSSFIRPDSGKFYFNMRSMFDIDAFIKHKNPSLSYAKFLKKFCNTLAFADLVEARILGTENNFLNFFDRSINFRESKEKPYFGDPKGVFFQKETPLFSFKVTPPEASEHLYKHRILSCLDRSLVAEEDFKVVEKAPLLFSDLYSRFPKIDLLVLPEEVWAKYLFQNAMTVWILGLYLKVRFRPSSEDSILIDYAFHLLSALDPQKTIEDTTYLNCLIKLLSFDNREKQFSQLLQKNLAKTNHLQFISLYLQTQFYKDLEKENQSQEPAKPILDQDEDDESFISSSPVLSQASSNSSPPQPCFFIFPSVQVQCPHCHFTFHFEEALASFPRTFLRAAIICLGCKKIFVPMANIFRFTSQTFTQSDIFPLLSPLALRKEVEDLIFLNGEEYPVEIDFKLRNPDLYWNIFSYFHTLQLPNPFALALNGSIKQRALEKLASFKNNFGINIGSKGVFESILSKFRFDDEFF